MKCKYKKFLKAAYIDYEEDYCSNAVLRSSRPPLSEILAPATFETTLSSGEGYYWTTFYTSMANYKAPEGVIVYKYHAEGSSLTRIPVEDRIINKGQGVVLKSSTSSVTLTKTYSKSSDDYSDNSLIGTDYLITNPGHAYVLGYKSSHGIAFYRLSSTGKIKANRAYLIVEDTYLTQWKIVGNSEVHGQEIWSCGEYSATDNKYHIVVQPLGKSPVDIALDAPLRKVEEIADTIEFPATLEAFCNTDGSQILTTLPDDTILHIKQFVKNGDFSDGSTEWRNGTSQTSCDYSHNKAVISNNIVGHGYKFGIIQDIRSNIVIGNSYYFKYNAIPCKDIVLGADFSNRSNARVSCVGNTNNIVSNVQTPASLNQFYLGFSPTTDYEIGDTTEVDNVVSFNLDVMFADCPSLKPSTASDFEALFTNINYIAYSDTAIDVIVKDGKLYKYVDTEGKALVTRNLNTNHYDSLTASRMDSENKSCNLSQILPSDTFSYTESVDTNIIFLCNKLNSYSLYYGRKADLCIIPYYKGLFIRNASIEQTVEAYQEYLNGLGAIDVIYRLATPTTELVDAPQIAEADSYSMVISQGAKAVEWSSFETE